MQAQREARYWTMVLRGNTKPALSVSEDGVRRNAGEENLHQDLGGDGVAAFFCLRNSSHSFAKSRHV